MGSIWQAPVIAHCVPPPIVSLGVCLGQAMAMAAGVVRCGGQEGIAAGGRVGVGGEGDVERLLGLLGLLGRGPAGGRVRRRRAGVHD
jgi:hypothetical protein